MQNDIPCDRTRREDNSMVRLKAARNLASRQRLKCVTTQTPRCGAVGRELFKKEKKNNTKRKTCAANFNRLTNKN